MAVHVGELIAASQSGLVWLLEFVWVNKMVPVGTVLPVNACLSVAVNTTGVLTGAELTLDETLVLIGVLFTTCETRLDTAAVYALSPAKLTCRLCVPADRKVVLQGVIVPETIEEVQRVVAPSEKTTPAVGAGLGLEGARVAVNCTGWLTADGLGWEAKLRVSVPKLTF